MNVLLIEDDKWIAAALDAAFEGLTITTTLADALFFLAHHHVRMVFVDLNLSDSKGLDTLRALTRFAVPKIVITANRGLCEEAASLGASDYIVKTGDVSQVIERIRFNLSRLNPRRQRFAPQAFEEIKAHLSLTTEAIPANMGA